MDYRKSNREPARKNALGEEPMRDVTTSEARDANEAHDVSEAHDASEARDAVEAHDAASDSLGSAPTKKTDCKWPERSDIVEPCDVWFKGDDRAIVTCSPNSPHPRVYLMKHETIWTVDDVVEDADLEQLLEGYELAPNETEDQKYAITKVLCEYLAYVWRGSSDADADSYSWTPSAEFASSEDIEPESKPDFGPQPNYEPRPQTSQQRSGWHKYFGISINF